MTYPPSNPGYPPQSGSQFEATQQFAKAVPAQIPATQASAAPGESKLAEILLAVVAAAGFITYLVSFALDSSTAQGFIILVGLPLLGALLAGVSLLPKQKNYTAVAAVVSTIPFLFVVAAVVQSGGEIGGALWAILALTLIQAGAAIAALLFDAGVITPPAPKPQFDQQPQYGQYGGPSQYYGQQHQPQGGQPYQQAQPQRPGYPSQYGGYPGAQNTGGFPVQPSQGQQGQQPSGPPTPPTGYPTYGQPQQSPGSAPTTSVPAQPQAQQSSSQQSGPAPS
ncbi:hypothetical protein A5740_13540 [Mycobacterium sp. GA-1841]|uniref:DUF5336 domain-containing protein n=1 Tax=Mycobacterium sp. GA-1841 TaxID=1834154 RepID=UPI00096FB82A|nr:DUF5336 domain-containing protein [Mycobacterium sp. GA-1841]OMC32141.1 hypothetical protein A5740_13540 [Mycobacterium sp. GA-1841]